MRQIETVALEDARRVIAGGGQKAREIESPSNVAVVDEGGNLVAHIRMDDAWMGSIDISIYKAFTARAFDTSTADLAKNAQPGDQFYGVSDSNHGRVMIFAGGLPLRGSSGNVVGGVGVFGSIGEQDQAVAENTGTLFEQPTIEPVDVIAEKPPI